MVENIAEKDLKCFTLKAKSTNGKIKGNYKLSTHPHPPTPIDVTTKIIQSNRCGREKQYVVRRSELKRERWQINGV